MSVTFVYLKALLKTLAKKKSQDPVSFLETITGYNRFYNYIYIYK